MSVRHCTTPWESMNRCSGLIEVSMDGAINCGVILDGLKGHIPVFVNAWMIFGGVNVH